MPTKKPLLQLIPDIIDHYNEYKDYLTFNLRLHRIVEGQLREEVEAALRKELISTAAYNRAKERIPPINILKKATDKLSKVYIEKPVRLADKETDMEIMQAIVREAHLDSVMTQANRIYNIHGMFAIEPYIEKRQHKFRVLGGHQFLPFSDDPVDPTRMTVMIKLLGKEKPFKADTAFDESGNKMSTQDDITEVDLLALYSDNEYLIIDEKGNPRPDMMLKMGQTTMVNPYGRIPFIVGNKSSFELVPFPNQEGLDASILIPKLLADLNFSAQFMSHSIIYTRNADLAGQEINPDAIIDLGDRSAEDGQPEIGVIKPEVDIDKVLQLVDFELRSYFASIGIKTQESGLLANGRDSSGISKAIDEGDTIAERKVQMEFFRNVESQLWGLVSDMQRVLSQVNIVEENRQFSQDFLETFRIKYAEMRAFKSDKQKLEEIQLWRDLQMMTRKQALRELRPDFTESQIDDWIFELDNEAKDNMERALENIPTLKPERNRSGQFNEGNQVAGNQDDSSGSERQA